MFWTYLKKLKSVKWFVQTKWSGLNNWIVHNKSFVTIKWFGLTIKGLGTSNGPNDLDSWNNFGSQKSLYSPNGLDPSNSLYLPNGLFSPNGLYPPNGLCSPNGLYSLSGLYLPNSLYSLNGFYLLKGFESNDFKKVCVYQMVWI